MPLREPPEALSFDLYAQLEDERPAVPPVVPLAAPPEEPSAFTVAQLYERINRALRLQMPDDVWIIGEIRKVSVHRNGHRFVELSDPDGAGAGGAGSGAPTVEVVCWSRDWPTVAAELDSVGVDLAAGLMVRILGRVGVWEAGSRLRVTMTALDVDALVGGIAAARRRLIGKLRAEGLLEANRRLAVPVVPLRIGVVTSGGSEAYRDFTGTLKRSGVAFDVRLESSLVQGTQAPAQIAGAIAKLQTFRPDLIVLVRGGGARGDLAAFDSEPVARAIARSRYPVWTGIGHTGDQSVADEVSQRALVTPTACAEAVVELVRAFLEHVKSLADEIVQRAEAAVLGAEEALERDRRRLERAAHHQLERATDALRHSSRLAVRATAATTEKSAHRLSASAEKLVLSSRHCLASASQHTTGQRRMLAAFDPQKQLARGWSLTRGPDGRILRSAAAVAAGDTITTVVADGQLSSVVGQVRPRDTDPAGERSEQEASSEASL